MGSFVLKSFEFRREREAAWAELERLVARVESVGLRALTEPELRRLPILYRSALSSLSVARAISLDKNVVTYLESLSARAYVCVYAPKRGFFDAALEFVTARFPALVYRMRGALWLAIGMLLLGTAVGLVVTLADPERFYSFVEAGMAGGRGPTSTKEELEEVLRGTGGGSDLTFFASFLFTHNAKIGLMCVALGFLAAVPVVLLVFVNGLTLGAMIAIHQPKGLALDFIAWVLPHGVTELLAVCLCGAAGITIGRAIVFPGRLRRVDNLARLGREAGGVVVGAVGLFFLAALLEGYFRQLVHGTLPRLVVASLTLVGWSVYFARGKRAAAELDAKGKAP